MKAQGIAVLIKPDVLPERTKTGKLVIPKSSKEMLPDWGTVVDCGPACTRVKKEERVMFPRKSASVITIDGEDFYFTYEHKLLYNREAECVSEEMKEYTCSVCGKTFWANVPATLCPSCYI